MLTEREKSEFITNGAVIKRRLVPEDLVHEAQQLVNEWYETSLNRAQIGAYTQRTFAPEHGSDRRLLALVRAVPVAQVISTLLGEYVPLSTVQVQIRIPERDLADPQPVKDMHVDGVACPHLDPDELRTFSLLVGVALSEVSDGAGGALRYQPRGHERMADWFRREWRLGLTDQVPPELDAQEGVPLLVRPGDVVFMHHLMPHAVGRNNSRTPRVMAYFRVSHPSHATRRLESLQQPWLDYAGLRGSHDPVVERDEKGRK